MRTTEITIRTGGRRGVFDITEACRQFVEQAAEGDDGLLVAFVPHATCGLVVMELGAGSEDDFLAALDRLLPRDDRYVHRHGSAGHGADHVVPAFFPPSMTIPIVDGQLALGTWQSIGLLDTNVDNPTRRVRLTIV
jgi:secondary thiamine-phosphate synthase enzyme